MNPCWESSPRRAQPTEHKAADHRQRASVAHARQRKPGPLQQPPRVGRAHGGGDARGQPPRDVEFGGKQIKQGDQLLLMYSSANRDPEHFDRPEEFDVVDPMYPMIVMARVRRPEAG